MSQLFPLSEAGNSESLRSLILVGSNTMLMHGDE